MVVCPFYEWDNPIFTLALGLHFRGLQRFKCMSSLIFCHVHRLNGSAVHRKFIFST